MNRAKRMFIMDKDNKLATHAKQFRPNPHKVMDEIAYRWSPRSMSGEQMPDEALTPLFAAAGYAPSSFNEQPWIYHYAHRDTDSFTKLLGCLTDTNRRWCVNASFLIVLVSRSMLARSGKANRSHSFDAGASWHALAIEGVRRGLVVHAMGGFDHDAVRTFLDLDAEQRIECMIAVGKPSAEVSQEQVSDRKAVSDIAIRLGSGAKV